MHKSCFAILLFLLFSGSLTAQEYIDHCLADRVLAERKRANPSLVIDLENLELFIQKQIGAQSQQAQLREFTATIPVVVHIVWIEDSENLSDDIIQSQIEVLNEDFQKRNSNRINVPDDFAPLIANIGFEFCLVSVDPNNQPSSGITRTSTTVDCIGNIKETKQGNLPNLFYESLGGADAWDTEHYLNIWVAPTCNAFLGSASFPGMDIPEEDGVVIDSKYFGVRSADSPSAPFHLGRTTTHEVGHYFNLKHTWGEQGCAIDDLVADTPQQEEEYRGCPIHPNSSCDSPDMFMNFMNYVNDDCLMFFTKGQKQRMLATLSGPRSGLIENNFCTEKEIEKTTPFTVFPNPARDCIHVLLDGNGEEYPWELYDAGGRRIDWGNTQTNKIHQISLQGLASGIYFVKVLQGEVVYAHKILVLPGSF